MPLVSQEQNISPIYWWLLSLLKLDLKKHECCISVKIYAVDQYPIEEILIIRNDGN